MIHKPGYRRYVLLSVFCLGIVSIFLSFSRGSWLGALLALLGLLALYPKHMLPIGMIFLVGAGVLGSTVLSTELSYASERLVVENTIGSRLELSNAQLKMVQVKPFFGWGFENESNFSRQFLSRPSRIKNPNLSSHNTYLTIWVETGIVGLSLYLFPLVYWLLRVIKALPRLPKNGLWSRALLITLLLITLNQFVASNFMDMRFFSFGLTLWWITLGLIANMVTADTDVNNRGAVFSLRNK